MIGCVERGRRVTLAPGRALTPRTSCRTVTGSIRGDSHQQMELVLGGHRVLALPEVLGVRHGRCEPVRGRLGPARSERAAPEFAVADDPLPGHPPFAALPGVEPALGQDGQGLVVSSRRG